MGHNRAGDRRKKKQRNRAKIERLRASSISNFANSIGKFNTFGFDCRPPTNVKSEYDPNTIVFYGHREHDEFGKVEIFGKHWENEDYYCLTVKDGVTKFLWLTPAQLDETKVVK